MEKKKNWDNVPSLQGLEMDWDYQPDSAKNQRASVRLNVAAVAALFDTEQIMVKIATAGGESWTVPMLDLCEGGVCLEMPVSLATGQLVKVGFYLGARTIISKAEVQHVCASGPHAITGCKFIGLDQESAEFLKSLYSAQVLKHAL